MGGRRPRRGRLDGEIAGRGAVDAGVGDRIVRWASGADRPGGGARPRGVACGGRRAARRRGAPSAEGRRRGATRRTGRAGGARGFGARRDRTRPGACDARFRRPGPARGGDRRPRRSRRGALLRVVAAAGVVPAQRRGRGRPRRVPADRPRPRRYRRTARFRNGPHAGARADRRTRLARSSGRRWPSPRCAGGPARGRPHHPARPRRRHPRVRPRRCVARPGPAPRCGCAATSRRRSRRSRRRCRRLRRP